MDNYILLHDGTTFDYETKVTSHLSLQTLIHHISQINRYLGATVFPYSVARHSLLAAEIALAYVGTQSQETILTASTAKFCRNALLHDIHEAVIGDVPTPLKNHILFHSFENAVQDSFARSFNYTPSHESRAIQRLDRLTLAAEVWYFFPDHVDEFNLKKGTPGEEKAVLAGIRYLTEYCRMTDVGGAFSERLQMLDKCIGY